MKFVTLDSKMAKMRFESHNKMGTSHVAPNHIAALPCIELVPIMMHATITPRSARSGCPGHPCRTSSVSNWSSLSSFSFFRPSSFCCGNWSGSAVCAAAVLSIAGWIVEEAEEGAPDADDDDDEEEEEEASDDDGGGVNVSVFIPFSACAAGGDG
jgi:hypothetical protein